MGYIRKIIYLNEYGDGSCGANAGFAKISKKETRLKIEINLSGGGSLRDEKVYLLNRDKNAVNKVFTGTISSDERIITILGEDSVVSGMKGEITGIIIGGEDHIVCAGTVDADINIMNHIRMETVTEEEEEVAVKEEGADVEAAEYDLEKETRVPEEMPVKGLEIPVEEEQEEPEEEEEIIQVEIEEAHDEAYEYRKILKNHPNMYPFEDDEMEESVQLSPSDLSDFPQRFWNLASNSFLLEGYYKYRHLVFVRVGEKLYLGIPGQYHRRDKFLADMFGFGRFKSIYRRTVKLGDFGYWLMEIDIMPSAEEPELSGAEAKPLPPG